jgi:hypothetical protein
VHLKVSYKLLLELSKSGFISRRYTMNYLTYNMSRNLMMRPLWYWEFSILFSPYTISNCSESVLFILLTPPYCNIPVVNI